MRASLGKVIERFSVSTPEIPACALAAAAAVFVTLANNGTLLENLVNRVDLHTVSGLWAAVTFPLIITAVTFILFLILGPGRILKPLIAVYLVVASTIGFFVNEYGVVFSESMIRNMADTVAERNLPEVTELVSPPLLLHIFLVGLLPALAFAAVKVRKQTPIRGLTTRLATGTVVALLGGIIFMADSDYLILFSAKNRDLRHFITPLYAISSAEKYFRHLRTRNGKVFHELGQDAHLREGHKHRTLGVLIVGETARADHFSLNGYERETNPLLAKDSVVSFTDTHSCGTATAVSVPCMFSMRDQAQFDVESIRHESNVLDILRKANVDVIWLDGNSGCKHVCARVDFESVTARSMRDGESEYFDSMLVDSMVDHLDSLQRDTLIILHMLGSHGPAYGKRVPADFQVFQPACAGNSPTSCDRSQLINAYDNTILYTDFVVHRVIEELRQKVDNIDAFVLYVSDHGESLGEGGVFLHGLPYSLAPEEQKHVAMIYWGSSHFGMHHGLSHEVLSGLAQRPLSHDNVSHALLGLLDVSSAVYDASKDPFAGGGPAG